MIRNPEPRKGIEFLSEEHEETLLKTEKFYEALAKLQYRGRAALESGLGQSREALRFFYAEWHEHAGLEEMVIFPFIASHLPQYGPVIRLLLAEHGDFKNGLKQFRALHSEIGKIKASRKREKLMEDIRAVGLYLSYLLRQHIRAENETIYKAVANDLSKKEKEHLSQRIFKQLAKGDKK